MIVQAHLPLYMSATAAHWLCAHWANRQRQAGLGDLRCSHWGSPGPRATIRCRIGCLTAGFLQTSSSPGKGAGSRLLGCQCRRDE